MSKSKGTGIQTPRIAQQLEEMRRYRKDGRNTDAERICRLILKEDPLNAEALFTLGLLLFQQGQFGKALESYLAALTQIPDSAAVHYNLGSTYKALNRPDKAIEHFQRAVQCKPAVIDAYNNLGILYQQTGKPVVAAECFQQAVKHDPNNAGYHNNLGLMLRNLGKIEEAIAEFQRVTELQPGIPEVYNNLGLAQQSRGRTQAAVASFNRAVELRPDYAEAHFNLANLLHGEQQFVPAIEHYRKALTCKPDYSEAWNNLGGLFYQQYKKHQGEESASYHEEAAACFQKALTYRPDYVMAWINRGNTLRDAGRLQEAIEHFRQATVLEPNSADAWHRLGATLRRIGQLTEASKYLRKSLELNPDLVKAHSDLLFLLSYHVLCSPEKMLREHQAWDLRHGAKGRAGAYVHSRSDDPDRRLRVGYVSPDLRNHPVSVFFEPLLAAHDRAQVEVFCYAEVARPDAMTERLQELADHWRFTVGLSDAELARRIHEDRIDILVDLAGHTARNRLPAFTYKPAPVQATYLGYFTTTGLSAMDYWITDTVLTPEDTVEQATETFYRLPRCCLCYTAPADAPPVRDRAGDAPLTFGSFNDLSKISPAAVALWARVLHALPEARLLLKARQLAEPAAQQRITEQFATWGVRPERLLLRGWTASRQDHLALHGEVDIALDSVPRTGGTTTADALWMGIPVITLAGERFIERLSASMLGALELPELIAYKEDDFIAKAVALAQDPARRAESRATLRERMAASPLCDGPGLARAMEDAYRNMWRRHISGKE